MGRCPLEEEGVEGAVRSIRLPGDGNSAAGAAPRRRGSQEVDRVAGAAAGGEEEEDGVESLSCVEETRTPAYRARRRCARRPAALRPRARKEARVPRWRDPRRATARG
jgi:hypothetical protein